MVSDKGTLVMLQTAVEDQGTYRANLSNSVGEVSVEVELTFYYSNICRRECLNGGTCVQLPVCSCPENFAGRECELYTGPGVCVCVYMCVCMRA